MQLLGGTLQVDAGQIVDADLVAALAVRFGLAA